MLETTLGVTVRELSRCAAALLDEIERNGRFVVVCRYGRPVAVLGPLPDDYEPSNFRRTHVMPRSFPLAALVTDQAVEEDASDEVVPALGPRERAFLSLLATSERDWWMPSTPEELETTGCWFELEMKGLVESRPGGGWRLTSTGKRAVDMTATDAGR